MQKAVKFLISTIMGFLLIGQAAASDIKAGVYPPGIIKPLNYGIISIASKYRYLPSSVYISIDGREISSVSYGEKLVIISPPGDIRIQFAKTWFGALNSFVDCPQAERKDWTAKISVGYVYRFNLDQEHPSCLVVTQQTERLLSGNQFPEENFSGLYSSIFGDADVKLVGFDSASDLKFDGRTGEQITSDLKSEEARIAKRRQEQEDAEKERQAYAEAEAKAETERIAREGDGTEDDLACKAKRLQPSTPKYLGCRGALVKERQRLEAERVEKEKKKRLADEAAEAKRLALEAARAEKEAVRSRAINGQDPLSQAKRTCAELGFKPATEKFGDCVLQMLKGGSSSGQTNVTSVAPSAQEAESSVSCQTDADCPTNTSCRTKSYGGSECRAWSCRTDADCPTNSSCRSRSYGGLECRQRGAQAQQAVGSPPRTQGGDGSQDDATCQRYGFSVGSQQYSSCRLQLDVARQQAAQAQQQYQEQLRQYEEQKAAYEKEQQRQKGLKLLDLSQRLFSGQSPVDAVRGAQGLPPLTPPQEVPATQTYRMPNGRMVTCTTAGTMTNCF